MDSDCDPSEDSLNLHDLSGLDVEVSSDSDDFSPDVQTPKVPDKPKVPESHFYIPKCIDRSANFAQQPLVNLRDNVRRSLSMGNDNDAGVSSDASFGLLSDGKLDDDNDDILGTIGTTMQPTIVLVHSPSSDKENEPCKNNLHVAGDTETNETLKMIENFTLNTPLNFKGRSAVTPNSGSSTKKVSFNEQVVENSFQCGSNNSSDERISLSGVCDLPTRGIQSHEDEISLVQEGFSESVAQFTRSLEIPPSFQNDTIIASALKRSATTDDVLTSVTSRLNSSSTLRTDSNTSKIVQDVQPTHITTDYSAVFNSSVVRSSDTLSETRTRSSQPFNSEEKLTPQRKASDFGGGDRKPTPSSTTKTNSDDTFHKSFSMSSSRMQNNDAVSDLAFANVTMATLGKLFQHQGEKESRSDFSNIEFSHNTSTGDQIFRPCIDGYQSPFINMQKEMEFHNRSQKIDKGEEQVLTEKEQRTGSQSHQNLEEKQDAESSLTCLSGSCDSIASSSTIASDESDHVISLETIKETWPTLNSYMKAKEIAERFEKLCDGAKLRKLSQKSLSVQNEVTQTDYGKISSTNRNDNQILADIENAQSIVDKSLMDGRITEKSLSGLDENLKLAGSVVNDTGRSSVGATVLEELSEYPLNEDSVFVNQNLSVYNVSRSDARQQQVNFASAVSFTNLSCISHADSDSKESKLRGFSFSTPKVKNLHDNNSTSELLNSGSANQELYDMDENNVQEGLDESYMLSKYLKRTETSQDHSIDDNGVSNDTVVDACSFPTVYGDRQSLETLNVKKFAKTDPDLSSKLSEIKTKQVVSSLKESDIIVDNVFTFPDSITNVKLAKSLGIENRSDKWVIATLSLSSCRYSMEGTMQVNILANEVFNVSPQSVVISPKSHREVEFCFQSPKAGNFSGLVNISFSGTADCVNIEKTVKLLGRCEAFDVKIFKNGQAINALEMNYEFKNNSEKEKLESEIEVQGMSAVEVQLSCQIFCSLSGALNFSSLNDESIVKSNRVAFSTPRGLIDRSQSSNKLGIEFNPGSVSIMDYNVVGVIKVQVEHSKGDPIAVLPVNIKITRQILEISESAVSDLVLKCDNDYAPLEFPISSYSSENVFVEIGFDKSLIEICPHIFPLKPFYRQKIRIKAKHSNISSSKEGQPIETKVEIVSNGVKQKEFTVKIEVPQVTGKRSILFGSNAKCMLFRSPQLFSPVVETLKMENSTNEALNVTVHVEKIGCFEISSIIGFSEKQEFDCTGGVYSLKLLAKANCKIEVKFHSFDVKLEHSYLIVRVKSSLLKYVVPLYGYSGRSTLVATTNQNSSNHDSKVKEVVLRNNGSQDLCFVVNEDSLKLCSVNPALGIIKAQSEKQLKVIVEHSKDNIEDLEINWGDYILKRMYDNCANDVKHSQGVSKKIRKLVDANFEKDASNVSAFIENISLNYKFLKFMDNSCFVPLDLDLLADDGRDDLPESERTYTSASTVVNGDLQGFSKVNDSTSNSDRWIVRPDCVLFKGNKTQSFVLQNKCDKSLEFLILTPDSVTANPSRGVLNPYEEVLVDVYLKKENLKHKLSRDSLVVKIENEVKEISLEFKINSSENVENASIVSACSSKGVSLNVNDELVTLVNEILKFPSGAKIGDCQQLTLSFTNNMSSKVKWVLSSVAPAFVKWNSDKMYKANYAVFRVEKSMGYLREKEVTELVVSFAPLDVGSYFQHWELHITSLSNSESKFIRICFCGEAKKRRKSLSAIPGSELDETDYFDKDETLKEGQGGDRLELIGADIPENTKAAKVKKKRTVVVSEQTLSFPDVRAGWLHVFLELLHAATICNAGS